MIEEAKKKLIIFCRFSCRNYFREKCNGLVFRWKSQLGTHTHIQTSDERILPNGTGYITDVGMTGYYDGILGINREEVIKRLLQVYHNDM